MSKRYKNRCIKFIELNNNPFVIQPLCWQAYTWVAKAYTFFFFLTNQSIHLWEHTQLLLMTGAKLENNSSCSVSLHFLRISGEIEILVGPTQKLSLSSISLLNQTRGVCLLSSTSLYSISLFPFSLIQNTVLMKLFRHGHTPPPLLFTSQECLKCVKVFFFFCLRHLAELFDTYPTNISCRCHLFLCRQNPSISFFSLKTKIDFTPIFRK